MLGMVLKVKTDTASGCGMSRTYGTPVDGYFFTPIWKLGLPNVSRLWRLCACVGFTLIRN